MKTDKIAYRCKNAKAAKAGIISMNQSLIKHVIIQ